MLLIYDDEKSWAKLSETERQQAIGEWMQFTQQIKSGGQYVASSKLHPTSEATSVRLRNGKRLATDGPFAETREQLGGYYLIEAKDLDEAIDIAARIPSARSGTIELRPLVERRRRQWRRPATGECSGRGDPCVQRALQNGADDDRRDVNGRTDC